MVVLIGASCVDVPPLQGDLSPPYEGPAFVSVQPSNFFWMGSTLDEIGRDESEELHEVLLTQPFSMQATEVTQEQWREVMGNNPSNFTSQCGGTCPVEQVNWWDALAYLNALSQREGLEQCYRLEGCSGTPGLDYACSDVAFRGLACTGFRLPTESEWEFAARAGAGTAFYNGPIEEGGCQEFALTNIAWYCGTSQTRTHAVGQKMPNAFGLHDMLGNAWEWVWDRHGPYPTGLTDDPLGPEQGNFRIVRGGGWNDPASSCRTSKRGANRPEDKSADLSFRAVRTLF